MSLFRLTYIIDDDPIYKFGMRILFKEIGFSEETLYFENGLEALEELKKSIESGEKLPEIIFLDLDMPVMDGWEFLEALGEVPRKPGQKSAIYVVSSSINPSDRNRALAFESVRNYIVKPLDAENLKKITEEN